MVDVDNFIPDKSLGDGYTEAMWDNMKEVINNNRRKRLLGVYTTGSITYNGSSSLAWTADIKILFMATNSDTYYINTITSASSPLTTADNTVIWCRLVNSTSNVTLISSTFANFNRANDMTNQSGDVFILGFNDATQFHFIGGGIDSIQQLASKANGDIFYWNSSALQRLPKGTDGQHLELASGLPSWVDKPVGGGSENHAKNNELFYEDFENYSNGDFIHNVQDDWPVVGANNYLKATTATAQVGSVSAEWKWGSSGEAGRHRTILPFGRIYWAAALKISFYWRIQSTGGGTYMGPVAQFYDSSAANGSKILHNFFYVPYVRHLSGNFQIYDDTSTFVNVASASTGTWHLCELWIRNGNQYQNSRTQVHVKMAGSHFPSATGWEDLHSTPADYDTVGIYGFTFGGSWSTTIQQLDALKVETFDPMSTAFS